MKKTFLLLSLVASAVCVPALAQEAQHDHQHGASSAPAPEKKVAPAEAMAADKAHAAGGSHNGMMMDMKAMCDMHRQMMKAGMPMAEHEAMMDKQMPGMTPDQKRQRIKMMDEKCK